MIRKFAVEFLGTAILVFFARAMSHFWKSGPSIVPVPRLPNAPAAGAKDEVENQPAPVSPGFLLLVTRPT